MVFMASTIKVIALGIARAAMLPNESSTAPTHLIIRWGYYPQRIL
tara:strand:+ start:298 stop:432 length:135 start_codon:yes stop_codon:yes gene_type:complete